MIRCIMYLTLKYVINDRACLGWKKEYENLFTTSKKHKHRSGKKIRPKKACEQFSLENLARGFRKRSRSPLKAVVDLLTQQLRSSLCFWNSRWETQKTRVLWRIGITFLPREYKTGDVWMTIVTPYNSNIALASLFLIGYFLFYITVFLSVCRLFLK